MVSAVSACQPGRMTETKNETKQGESVTTVAYGDQPSQFVELTLPPGNGRCGVVVIVHGGFWRTSYGLELGRPLAADLVGVGVATWNVEYRRVGGGAFRGTAGGGGWPATAEDVAAAVDALAGPVQKAAGQRLDLDRVVAIGHSAGGQLVGWLAARPGLPTGSPGAGPAVALRGVIAQAGVLDLLDAARLNLGGGATQAFLGGEPAQHEQAYDLASPTARVTSQHGFGVPTVCVHGTADVNVPISQSQRFVAAATAVGDEATLHTFDGDHFALIDPSSPAWRTCREEILRLLG